MYQTTTEALQDLMNRGFLIYQEYPNNTWAIQKIATAFDQRPFLPPNYEVASVSGFSSQATALAQVIEWEIGPKMTDYVVEVQFNDGLGPKFKTLGVVKAATIDDAEKAGEGMAESHFARKKVRWTSRVRPKEINPPNWH